MRTEAEVRNEAKAIYDQFHSLAEDEKRSAAARSLGERYRSLMWVLGDPRFTRLVMPPDALRIFKDLV